MKLTILRGNVPDLNVDAIVNAANSSLMGGGGVDGAIHRAAGPELLDECKKIRETQYPHGLPTGEAVITKGYKLKAKYVIHTVGPIYERDDINLLKNCYLDCLKIAEENNCKTIAFPSISTGSYRVPIEKAAKIAHETVKNFKSDKIEEIIFALFSDYDYEVYKKEFEK